MVVTVQEEAVALSSGLLVVLVVLLHVGGRPWQLGGSACLMPVRVAVCCMHLPGAAGWSRRVPRDSTIRVIDFGSATFEDGYHSSIISTRHYPGTRGKAMTWNTSSPPHQQGLAGTSTGLARLSIP